MRTTGLRVAPQPIPRNAPATPVPLPRTKFALDASPMIKRKDEPGPTLRILAQTLPPGEPYVKPGHDVQPVEESESPTTTSSSDNLSPPVFPASRPTPPVPKSSLPAPSHTPNVTESSHTPSHTPAVTHTRLFPSSPHAPSILQSPPTSTDSNTPPPKPPRTYKHRSPGTRQERTVRGAGGARVVSDASGGQRTPMASRPGLMSVLSPFRHRPSKSPSQQDPQGPQARQSGSNHPQYSCLPPQQTRPDSQSLQSTDHTNQPDSLPLNAQTQTFQPSTRAPSVPPQSAKPRSTGQLQSLPPILPSRPSSSELNASRARHRAGQSSSEQTSGRQNSEEQGRDGQNRRHNGSEQASGRQNSGEQRNNRQNRRQNASEQRSEGQGNNRPATLQPTRPAPPPIAKKPPSQLRRPEPACTVEEFEASCQEVFKYRKSATKHAAAGRHAQAARHYQTALTAMDRVLGTHVLTITSSEPTRQHLFSLQEEVFTLRKEVLHGFMDAQTAVQTPSRLTISSTPTPGAPPSYDDVIKEDQRRHQEEIPPLPPRQPSMRGRASQYTRPRQSHTARHGRTNSGSEQAGSSSITSGGDSRIPRESSARPRPLHSAQDRPLSLERIPESRHWWMSQSLVVPPSTPATAPPTFVSQPLCPTQVPIRPKSYHSGHSSILTPLTPTDLPSHASTVVPPNPSKNATSSSSNILNSVPSLPPPTSSSVYPPISLTFAPSFSIAAKELGAKPKSPSSDPFSPVSPDTLDEVVESQMAALELCQTKRGARQTPKTTPPQHPSASFPITPESSTSLSKSPPPNTSGANTPDELFSELQSFNSAFSSGPIPMSTACNFQSVEGNINKAPSSVPVISKPSAMTAKIKDPFKTVDPFPPVNPEDTMSETLFSDEAPLPSISSRRKEGVEATEYSAAHHINKTSATTFKADKSGKVNGTKDENNQNESNFSKSNDGEDSILEALDFAIVKPHPKVTPRRSNGAVPRCHSEETLLDHSYGTLEAILKQDKAKCASRSSIIEEFDPLVTAFLESGQHLENTNDADGTQDTPEQATGGFDYPEATKDNPGQATRGYNYPQVAQDRVVDSTTIHDTAEAVGANAQPHVKLRGAPYPRVTRYGGIISVPEGEEEDRPVVYQEEGAMAGEEEEALGGEGLGVGGTYDDLYYDSDEDFSGKGISNTELRSSFSSQRSWPPDPQPSQLYPTIDKSDMEEESVDVGRSAFYRANSQPESPRSSTYRHLLRIREGVKIFFIHNDGVITSPYNKPVLSVTKDLTRNFLVGEGITVSVGNHLWRCELHSKQTLVLKTLSGVYMFKDTNGNLDCRAVGIRVPNNVRKAQHELLQHILQENTLMEEERPKGITKAISKGASTAATRVNTIVGNQMYETNQAFIRRNSIRALKGMSRRLNTLVEKTGGTLNELPEEYKELQEMADQLRISRSAKMVQYI